MQLLTPKVAPSGGLKIYNLTFLKYYLSYLAKHFLFFPPGAADSQLALPDCEELNGVEQFCKNCETELHSPERCVIQDMLSSLS